MPNSASVNRIRNKSRVRACGAGCEGGIGKLTLLVFGTLCAALLFAAYSILPFYYYYFELLNQMQSVARVASTHTDQELRQKLLYHIKKMELPVDSENLTIVREEQVIKIRLPYYEVFYVTWQGKDYDLWRFDFNAEVVERY